MREFEILAEEKQMEAMAREYAEIKKMRILPQKRIFHISKLPQKKIQHVQKPCAKTEYLIKDACVLAKRLEKSCRNLASKLSGEAKRHSTFAADCYLSAATALCDHYHTITGKNAGEPAPFLCATQLQSAFTETEVNQLRLIEILHALEHKCPLYKECGYQILKANCFLSFVRRHCRLN